MSNKILWIMVENLCVVFELVFVDEWIMIVVIGNLLSREEIILFMFWVCNFWLELVSWCFIFNWLVVLIESKVLIDVIIVIVFFVI